MILTLPYPPSVNHYYRRVGPRTLISREGREYRTQVCGLLAPAPGRGGNGIRKPPSGGRIALAMDAFPPDRRRRGQLMENRMVDGLKCSDCGAVVPRKSPTQKYCGSCSEKRDLERKRSWSRTNPESPTQTRRRAGQQRRRMELSRQAGAQASTDAASGIAWYEPEGPDLLWMARVAVPFTYAASKNHIYTMRGNGHVALRRESRQIRQAIALSLRQALHCMPIVHNKVWIDILVQKPNHKGDAVNVVDLVCDAVKDAIDRVDDRWFCLRRLDWEIVKDNPRLFIGVGQDSDEDCQVCSYCGQIKPLTAFNRSTDLRLGVGRECRECRRQGRLLSKRLSSRSSQTESEHHHDN